jgi:3-deoxy-D-manno-octulosonic-acid transferase
LDLLLYNLLLHGLAAPFLTFYYGPKILLDGKYSESLQGKLGRLPDDINFNSLPRPLLWLHAVSVGEASALSPLASELSNILPDAAILVSTGTETGQAKAKSVIKSAAGFFYLPLDFPGFTKRVVKSIRPDLFVMMETEIWPNLIHQLKKEGSAIAIANGRISDRSFPRYKRLRRFFSSTLEKIDLFAMGTALDADRVFQMGAPRDRIHVTGNMKFDSLIIDVNQGEIDGLRTKLSLDDVSPVFVAGSTHPGEHEIILDAYLRLKAEYPGLVLIIVPRHIDKTDLVVASVRERGINDPILMSSMDAGESRGNSNIVIIDKMGELFKIYSLASLVFVGGSLVPKGGQNILEPAMWGKRILFGPSMEDFREAREMLISVGSATQVADLEELVRVAREILSDRTESLRLGEEGKKSISRHFGSAAITAQMLAQLVSSKGKRV